MKRKKERRGEIRRKEEKDERDEERTTRSIMNDSFSLQKK